MRDHLAVIRRDQILAVHPTVLLLLRVVLLHQVVQVQIDQVLAVRLVVLHLHHQDRRQSQRDQIVSVVVKIYQPVAVHLIALAQRVRYRRGVKPAIHAGFVQSL
jgi:hypothetical protein